MADTTADDLRFFTAIYHFDPSPFLQRIRCPFLGIWGELDTYVPVEKSMHLTKQALKDAGNTNFELKLLPRTNHAMRLAKTGSPNEPFTEFSPEFWKILNNWLVKILR